ncbi:alpha/beta hydrolase [Bradyrhizobium sp. NBAIM01]|uniref:alpha/beta fold hydrolase n=1 Tax=Bradyrhizobium sp. NBAIM01 TaxID=2793818 RepID=UPI001CD7D08F|nr:alpha/beta hydrolase [Bradyrhizobium sp. NBAIM01]MCA1510543.1 alpha/beta hydrolase [Bradyrhizobium sp. NBAIM01]
MLHRYCVLSGHRLQLLHRRSGKIGILLIHGNSSCKEVFSKQLKDLARTKLGIVAPDLPGHGASDDSMRPSKTYSFPGYARLLGELMSKLGYESYHVVGWSLGGHIGLEMLACNPAVRSLLISGTPPIRLTPAGAAEGFRWTGATALAGRRHFKPEDVRRYTNAMMGVHISDNHHLVRMTGRTDGNARYWMVANGMAGQGADEVATVMSTDRPVAVIQGSADPFLRMEYLNNVPFGSLWRGRPVLIAAGHAAHWQAPRAFNEAMMDFVTAH